MATISFRDSMHGQMAAKLIKLQLESFEIAPKVYTKDGRIYISCYPKTPPTLDFSELRTWAVDPEQIDVRSQGYVLRGFDLVPRPGNTARFSRSEPTKNMAIALHITAREHLEKMAQKQGLSMTRVIEELIMEKADASD